MPKGPGTQVGHRFLIRLSYLILEDPLSGPRELTFPSNCEASPNPYHRPSSPSMGPGGWGGVPAVNLHGLEAVPEGPSPAGKGPARHLHK